MNCRQALVDRRHGCDLGGLGADAGNATCRIMHPRSARIHCQRQGDAAANQHRSSSLVSVTSSSYARNARCVITFADRYGNQIRLYDKMGNLKKTFDLPWKPVTVPADGKIEQSGGATVALALSRDAAQTFMFVVNQNNSQIDIVERQTGKLLSSLGEIGNLPGQFNQPHSVAVDSRNNLYVVENRGRRIHKFRPVGQ
jgi:DNA-binding beta-propeller fold protein YncE